MRVVGPALRESRLPDADPDGGRESAVFGAIRREHGNSNIDQEPGHMVVVGQSVTDCSKLTTGEAREVADAVSRLARHPWPLVLIYDVAEPIDNFHRTTISFDLYFPDGQFLLWGGGR